MTDGLRERLGAAAAEALREWADGRNGTIRLDERVAGSTTVVLDVPTADGRRTSERLTVEVVAADRATRAAAALAELRQLRSGFSERHLVHQPHDRYPVGRTPFFLIFSEPPADAITLAEAPLDRLVEMYGAIGDVLLNGLNSAAAPEVEPVSVADLVRSELRGAPDMAGLARNLPPGTASIECLRGRSIGDGLIRDAVLISRRPSTRADIRFADVSDYVPDAPLSRDIAVLLVRALERFAGTGLDPAESEELLAFACSPHDGRLMSVRPMLTDLVQGVHRAAAVIPESWQPDWRTQYQLSLYAAAARGAVRTSGQATLWLDRLAEHAAAAYRGAAPRPAGSRAGPRPAVRRVVAPGRGALTPANRMTVPLQRRTSFTETFLPAVRAAFTSPHALVIHGDAGLGKSVLLGQLHDELAADEGLGIVLVSAAAKSPDRARDLAELDLQFGNAVAMQLPLTGILSAQRADGRSPVVLLDTLDLLLDDASIPLLAALVRRLVDDGIPVVMTCREFEYRTYLEDSGPRLPLLESVLEPLPVHRLQEREIRAFAAAYLAANHPGVPTAFIERLLHLRARRRAVVEICGSPLLLRLTCELYGGDEVPEDLTVARLYQRYWRQNVLDDPSRRLAAAEAAERERICLAAGRLLMTRSTSAFEEEFDPYGHAVGADPVALDRLRSTGVLTEGSVSGRMRFFHQTLAEFAAALDLSTSSTRRAAYLASLRDTGRGSHLWAVLLQLLYVVDDADYAATVAALDLTEQFALRAAALSAVTRGDRQTLDRLAELSRGLSADHQRHLFEALGSAGETVHTDAVELLTDLVEVVADSVVFALAGVIGRLIRRHHGDRSDDLATALPALIRRRSRMKDEGQRDELLRAMLTAMAAPDDAYTPAELGRLRLYYLDLGKLGRAQVVRLHRGASPGQLLGLLQIAVAQRAPESAREDLVELFGAAAADPVASRQLGWSEWRDLLAAQYKQHWDDIQVAAAVQLVCSGGPAEISRLLHVALEAGQPLAQRAVHTAERVAGQLPRQMMSALTELEVDRTGRWAALVRTVTAHLPELPMPEATRAFDWILSDTTSRARDLLQAAAHVGQGQPELLERVLSEALGGPVELSGQDLSRLVTVVLDRCPAHGLHRLRSTLLPLVTAELVGPDVTARIAGSLAPVDPEARRRSLQIVSGPSGGHASTAAGQMVTAAVELEWFDPVCAAVMLDAATPNVVAEAARWIKRWQRDPTPLTTPLAAAVLTALWFADKAPVAHDLLAVVENDVRHRGPLRAHLSDIVDQLITRAQSTEGAPSDLQRSLAGGALTLLRHLLGDAASADWSRETTIRAFRTLPMDMLEDSDNEVERLVRLASRSGAPPSTLLTELLELLPELPGRVQLGVAKAVAGLRGERSNTYRTLGKRTSEPLVLAHLSRHLT